MPIIRECTKSSFFEQCEAKLRTFKECPWSELHRDPEYSPKGKGNSLDLPTFKEVITYPSPKEVKPPSIDPLSGDLKT
jgi:hypothetical protein